jgi:hypothetical protein
MLPELRGGWARGCRGVAVRGIASPFRRSCSSRHACHRARKCSTSPPSCSTTARNGSQRGTSRQRRTRCTVSWLNPVPCAMARVLGSPARRCRLLISAASPSSRPSGDLPGGSEGLAVASGDGKLLASSSLSIGMASAVCRCTRTRGVRCCQKAYRGTDVRGTGSDHEEAEARSVDPDEHRNRPPVAAGGHTFLSVHSATQRGERPHALESSAPARDLATCWRSGGRPVRRRRGTGPCTGPYAAPGR